MAAADATNTTTDVVDPKVNDLINRLKLDDVSVTPGLDLTQLTVFPYVNASPAGGRGVFDQANLAPAVAAASTGVPNSATTPVPANQAVLQAMIGGLQSVGLNNKAVDINVISGFHVAAKRAFLVLFEARYLAETGIVLLASDRISVDGWIEAVATDTWKAVFGPAAQPFGPDETLDTWTSARLAEVSDRFDALDIPYSHRIYVLESSTARALSSLVFTPWLTLAYVYARFVASERTNYLSKIMARYLFIQIAVVALKRLSQACPDKSDLANTFMDIASRVGGMMDTEISQVEIDADMVKVIQKSQGTRDASDVVARESQSLGLRRSRTSDLRIRLEVDGRDVARVRRSFYAWLAAYVAVLAVSAYLISTDQVELFMALALFALSFTTLYVAGSLLVARLSRN